MQKLQVLKQYFGYTSFRNGQEELADSILHGHDTLGIMPTGAGKSICFQLPALMLDGITLVVSPLISLMKDQVHALTQAGIKAAYLNTSLSKSQYLRALKNAKNNMYKIIYIAPERLLTDDFLLFVKDAKIAMVTVDEAHCVSQWGQNFRPSYLKIAKFVRGLCIRPVVSAFTATATPQVRDDIIDKLGLQKPLVLTTGFNRENLFFSVEKPKSKLSALKNHVLENADKSGLVYCLTRKAVEHVCRELTLDGYSATRFHAGLTSEERNKNQDLHYNMPGSIESYYQEAGRAGRDGTPADCIVFYGPKDVMTNKFLIKMTSSENGDPEEITKKDMELLKHITFYCNTTECLRAYLLNYFGENAVNYCGNCLNCNINPDETDITSETQQVLSCVKRTGARYGIRLISDILHGNKTPRISEKGFDQLPEYGALAGVTEKTIGDIVHYLIIQNYLQLSVGEYPVLTLAPGAHERLAENKPLRMHIFKSYKNKKKPKNALQTNDINGELFKKLKLLRAMFAASQKVPAFVVFSDATLKDMCERLPTDSRQFLRVAGVGNFKLDKYGEQFIKVIRDYVKQP